MFISSKLGLYSKQRCESLVTITDSSDLLVLESYHFFDVHYCCEQNESIPINTIRLWVFGHYSEQIPKKSSINSEKLYYIFDVYSGDCLVWVLLLLHWQTIWTIHQIIYCDYVVSSLCSSVYKSILANAEIGRFFCEDGKHRGITWVNDKNSSYFAHSNWKANNGSQRFWIKIPGQKCAESMDIYSKAIRWSELCYRIVNIVLVRITVVASILPLYITCMYTYYSSTTPSKDAFVLTYYMWYVKITPTKNTTVKLFLARLHIIGYHLIGKIHSDILSYV